MTEAGFRWDRFTVQNLENGRRASVTVDEFLALAYVLSVAPVHLLVPPVSQHDLVPAEEDALGRAPYAYAITPTTSRAPTSGVRGWIRGERTIGAVDPRVYFSEVPPDELRLGSDEERLAYLADRSQLNPPDDRGSR